MEFRFSTAVVKGSAHEKQGLPCQDKVYVKRGETVSSAALADGAGSRINSEYGADCAVHTVTVQLCEQFEELWQLDHVQIAVKVREYVVQAMQAQPYAVYDQACTLLFFAGHADGRYLSGHIGDGVQVLVSAQAETLVFSGPENGEYANETWFITAEDAVSHLRIRKGRLEAGGTLLMMSDGTAGSLYQNSTGTPAPACRTIAHWLAEDEDEMAVSADLEDNMRQLFAQRSGDDMSLVLVHWE